MGRWVVVLVGRWVVELRWSRQEGRAPNIFHINHVVQFGCAPRQASRVGIRSAMSQPRSMEGGGGPFQGAFARSASDRRTQSSSQPYRKPMYEEGRAGAALASMHARMRQSPEPIRALRRSGATCAGLG